MKNAARVILILLIFCAVLSLDCSKSSTGGIDTFIPGKIQFYNIATTTVILGRMSQFREEAYEVSELDITLRRGNRYDLPNILDDNGIIFPGGDRVFLVYHSAAMDNSGQPLFTKSIEFTVNGTHVVTIKGQDGQYEISGN